MSERDDERFVPLDQVHGSNYVPGLTPARDWEAELLAEWLAKLPGAYYARRDFGGWDLYKADPATPWEWHTGIRVANGTRNRWAVNHIAKLHSRARSLPYAYSDAYKRDMGRGRRIFCWWARAVCFLRVELGI